MEIYMVVWRPKQNCWTHSSHQCSQLIAPQTSQTLEPGNIMKHHILLSPIIGAYKLLHGLNQHKATGPDEISTKFLKEMAAPVTPALTFIFHASLNQGQTPEDWKLANVSPIFKKGNKSKPANYRPVSLTSVCCKVIEHINHSHLMKFFENKNILTDYQHGFRKKRSCES